MTSETVADVLAEMRNSGWPSNAENWAERIDRALRGAEAVESLGIDAVDWRNASGPITPEMIGAALVEIEDDPDSYENRELIADRLNALISVAPPAPAASVPDWRQAFIENRKARYIELGMKVEQARINAETDAEMVEIYANTPPTNQEGAAP